MADPGTYRPAVEVKAYEAMDPHVGQRSAKLEFRYPTHRRTRRGRPDNIARLTAHMLSEGHLAEAEIEELKKEVQDAVDDAVQFALQSTQPSMDDAWGI